MSPGEPPRRASAAPTTETLRTVPQLPLSLRLIGRSSAPGALVIAAITLVFVAVVPLVAQGLQTSQPAGDGAVAARGTLELSLADGWTVDSQTMGVTTLVSGSATLTVQASTSAPGSLEPLVDDAVARLAEDPSANWVITDPAPFTTTSRHPGFTVTATSETLSTQTWVVDNGALDTVSTLTAPLESWQAAVPGAEEIVNSMEVAPAAQPQPSPGEPMLP